VCETWSFTSREEHRLRVYDNRVLRRIFGPKDEEVAGGWRRLHNEELHNVYTSPNVIRVIKLRRMACSMQAEMRSSYKIMVVKPEGKT
jgi:hypothetical protein